jgi:hypothetical protein
LWFPLIREIIYHQIKLGSQLIIAIDRTQWQENNVLMVSAIIQKRAFPIFWTLLDKKGSCNLAEQKQVLRPVIRLLNKYKLVVVGDREFHSLELAQWLHGQRSQLQGQHKYVCRLTEAGKTRRRHSNFWIGLYGESWLIGFQACQLWVEEMLSLIANKKSFYQRGLRAINLIQQPLKRLGRPLKVWSLSEGSHTSLFSVELCSIDSGGVPFLFSLP